MPKLDYYVRHGTCILRLLCFGAPGHVAQCVAEGMRAMYQLIGRRAGWARTPVCLRFVLQMRGALNWACKCSKIENVEGSVRLSIEGGFTSEPDSWRSAGPSAQQPWRMPKLDYYVRHGKCILRLLNPALSLALRKNFRYQVGYEYTSFALF